MKVRVRKNDGVPKKKGYDNAPYARLLAAEATYLQERGWSPWTTPGGGIVWKDPLNKEYPDQRFRMDVAVDMQRQREPDEVRYDESAAKDATGARVAKILRIYDAAKTHAVSLGHHVIFSGKGARCVECSWIWEE